jgi:phosphopantetheinyl transferase
MRASSPTPPALDVDVGAELSLGPRHPRLAPGELHVWVADLAGGSLRELLARYVGVDARSIQLDADPGGKPVLAGDRRGEGTPHFNVSHSGDVAVYALATDPVGVDVELVRASRAVRRRDYVAVARRAFGAPVAKRLAGLDEETQEREFLRLWTRHEAALKLDGGGIAARLDGAAPDAWIAELDLGPAVVAAVASGPPAPVLRRWRLG